MAAIQQPRPKCIPRTSEAELHLMGNLLDRHQDKAFYATEKLDGFSFSFGEIDGQAIASTRDRIVSKDDDSVFGQAIRKWDLTHPLGINTIFQAELVGPGIRGNRYGLDRLNFFVFDVIRDGKRLSFFDATDMVAWLGWLWVPVLADSITIDRSKVESLARNQSCLNPSVQREGIVCRTMVETWDEFQGRVSFKVFNPAYPFHH